MWTASWMNWACPNSNKGVCITATPSCLIPWGLLWHSAVPFPVPLSFVPRASCLPVRFSLLMQSRWDYSVWARWELWGAAVGGQVFNPASLLQSDFYCVNPTFLTAFCNPALTLICSGCVHVSLLVVFRHGKLLFFHSSHNSWSCTRRNP